MLKKYFSMEFSVKRKPMWFLWWLIVLSEISSLCWMLNDVCTLGHNPFPIQIQIQNEISRRRRKIFSLWFLAKWRNIEWETNIHNVIQNHVNRHKWCFLYRMNNTTKYCVEETIKKCPFSTKKKYKRDAEANAETTDENHCLQPEISIKFHSK